MATNSHLYRVDPYAFPFSYRSIQTPRINSTSRVNEEVGLKLSSTTEHILLNTMIYYSESDFELCTGLDGVEQ